MWNLLNNAIKFTPAGGHVGVSLDDGIGITPDFLPHVFERFRQADPSTTRLYGGLGIGLSIVKSVAELHGGSVSVSSEGSGRGATFRVRIPLAFEMDAARTA